MGGKAKDVTKFRQNRKKNLVYVMGGKCALCGYDRCIGALEFHHINPETKKYGLSSGNCHSMKEDLLEAQKTILVCANCHREIENGLIIQPLFTSYIQERAEEVLRNTEAVKSKTYNYCIDCGKIIDSQATRCTKCASKMRRVADRPEREELKNLIRTQSFTKIGQQFGVSDNAIRKWCDSYQLPRKVSEIKSYSNEEWEKI